MLHIYIYTIVYEHHFRHIRIRMYIYIYIKEKENQTLQSSYPTIVGFVDILYSWILIIYVYIYINTYIHLCKVANTCVTRRSCSMRLSSFEAANFPRQRHPMHLCSRGLQLWTPWSATTAIVLASWLPMLLTYI